MRSALLFLSVVVASTPVWAQQERATYPPGTRVQSLRLVIAPHIAEELDTLADTLRVETVRCLVGTVEGTDGVIDLAWRPPIERSTSSHVEYQSCPSATLAVWHNHPQMPGEEPEYACYLSGVDVREALRPRAPPIQMVQVTSSVACWWSRWEIARAGSVPILLPRAKQRWGRAVEIEPARCWTDLQDVVACRLLRSCPADGTAVVSCAVVAAARRVSATGRPVTSEAAACADHGAVGVDSSSAPSPGCPSGNR